jgi:hypothetical protein
MLTNDHLVQEIRYYYSDEMNDMNYAERNQWTKRQTLCHSLFATQLFQVGSFDQLLDMKVLKPEQDYNERSARCFPTMYGLALYSSRD